MKLCGIGIIGPFGRGRDACRRALTGDGAQTAGELGGIPAKTVPDDLLETKELKSGARRADRLTRMFLAAATDAVNEAGLDGDERMACGLLLASAFGSHVLSFRFLDDLLDFGMESPSPTSFSHSVNNAPLFYVSQRLGIMGPNQAVCGFDASFASAFGLAECWLETGECRHVLLLAGDELGKVMLQMAEKYCRGGSGVPWGEGAVAFVFKTDHGVNDEASAQLDQDTESVDGLADLFGRTMMASAFAFALKQIELNGGSNG